MLNLHCLFFPSLVLKMKQSCMQEEENRKKMEELAIQRQKRIAERTAATGSAHVTSKKVPLGRKTASLG